ncbi:hypothetical protein GGI20_004152 [Coemansia sp. BCRC 34301]|nr:hypothetical protein GGI20_004152 [Coemansia sp. BCRC 34301]
MPSGNPFEASILVKCCRDQKVIHSFFVHELPPNSTISELHARIGDEQKVPFGDWVLTKRTSAGKQRALKVLKPQYSFADYEISSWDCVYVVPRHESPDALVPMATRVCGEIVKSVANFGKKYRARLGGALGHGKRQAAAGLQKQEKYGSDLCSTQLPKQCSVCINRSSSLSSMYTCNSFASTSDESVSSKKTMVTA